MLHTIHRLSACLIGGYIAVHLYNHLLALDSIDAHIAFMESFRRIYRLPFIEVLLLGCVAIQVSSGLFFIKNRWGERAGFYERLQAFSGGYLAFFLLNHIGAVLFGRSILNLDTNFYFAVAGLHITPFQYFFVPYYFFAMLAIFGHVACALHWLTREKLSPAVRNRLSFSVITVGALVSFLIILALAGGLYPVEIPTDYMEPYGGI